ncbi:hypothetical protein [Halorientalis salina]|uniref:hypothetical protein n=1 Tax=Halorientalis salina TaxID=2932266 RepID=UPI0010AB545A|nr:hypothetical protein [Halorientalis salina]
MSTADRPAGPTTAASDVAAACRDADFVRLVATADGDALAATGVLARALDATDRPFQASVVAPAADTTRETEADLTVTIGHATATADRSIERGATPLSEIANAAARELAGTGDPVLALAGATTAPATPSGDLLEGATEAGAVQQPGVAIPTGNVADGLAHSTLVHAPFSGDADRTDEVLRELGVPESADELGADDRRRLASTVAIRTVKPESATARGAERVERALRPHALDGPFATVEGYGDVLDAVAREQPGTGVALALGHDTREAALSAWRTHGDRAHRALRSATTGRYDGLFVARGGVEDLGVSDVRDVPVGTVARLLGDFRSPEPVALFVTDGRAAATATDGRDLATTMEAAAAAVDGRAGATSHGAQATFETDTSDLIMAFREAL